MNGRWMAWALALGVTAGLLGGCELSNQAADHVHDTAVGQDSHGHREEPSAAGDDHGHGHGEETAAAGDDHGHGHTENAIAVTHFTDETELFVEFEPLVVGRESAFAAHLTDVSDFTPVAQGTLTVVLAGGGHPEERFAVNGPSVPGIFRPVAEPQYAGSRQLRLVLESRALRTVHDLGTVTVYPNADAAAHGAADEPEPDDAISYLKEQQWKVDFAMQQAERRLLRASIETTGTIRARRDGEQLVSAPTAGMLRASGTAFPRIGQEVKAGESLASIAPKLAGGADLSTLRLAVEKAEAEVARTGRERERLEGLLAQEAIPERRVVEARSAERVARAELNAARQRLERVLGDGDKGTGVPVIAPIDGTVARVLAVPGAFVDEGTPLVHVVDLERLWLEADIAETDVGRLHAPDGAWFEVPGYEAPIYVTPDQGARLVAFGGVVDERSRTVPLVFEFPNPERSLRVGMYTRAHVLTGEQREAVAIPASAVIDFDGQPVVFVQLGGESFQRRVVQLGLRDGEYVEVKSGVEPGEWVVSRGAYLVRLAAASPAEAGHGHAH